MIRLMRTGIVVPSELGEEEGITGLEIGLDSMGRMHPVNVVNGPFARRFISALCEDYNSSPQGINRSYQDAIEWMN